MVLQCLVMDIVSTSLDALLQRATNPQNQNIDTAAVEAFCALVNKEKDGAHIGVKLIATKIHSKNEKETLQALNVLDTCMKRCGASFHSEIGKFRFLNEMIKLVSPKYLGSQTALSVRQKVLQLMYVWTIDYPKESKIKEAYDMLKKQGVIREVPLSVCADNSVIPEKKSNSVFQDEEKSKLLQKLLQSKNPEDLQAANRLIKSMVKEDDKRAELKSRRITELESVHNNVRLLSEMLDSYRPGISSKDELELIKELHQSCERLRPNVFKLVADTQQNEELLNEVLQASDELGQVFDKYTAIIIQGKISAPQENSISLLDLGSPSTESSELLESDGTSAVTKLKSEIDVLCDIFTAANIPDSISTDIEILKPTTVLKSTNLLGNGDDLSREKSNKLKALEDLDVLGEHLLKENLSSSVRLGPQFNKISEKIPMNLLPKHTQSENMSDTSHVKDCAVGDALNFNLDYLSEKPTKNKISRTSHEDKNGDDVLVEITEEKLSATASTDPNTDREIPSKNENQKNMCGNKSDVKLNNLFVKLESIKPSSVAPLSVLNDKNGITVTLHFAKDRPREDVTVIVVTAISKNEIPLSNFLFRAVVPKVCKLKLQSPSGTELPAHNPFLPPSAITQIMLIANPENVQVSLKFIVSYIMDEETVTEMGEVEELPSVL